MTILASTKTGFAEVDSVGRCGIAAKDVRIGRAFPFTRVAPARDTFSRLCVFVKVQIFLSMNLWQKPNMEPSYGPSMRSTDENVRTFPEKN